MQTQRLSGMAALCLLLVLLLPGCSNTTPDDILGRWQRVDDAQAGQAFLGDPLGSLAQPTIEFREQGLLVELIPGATPEQFFMGRSSSYSFPKNGTIQIDGLCWQGWQSYACSQVYGLRLIGDSLTLSDTNQPAQRIAYRRIAALSPDLPPTLAPPLPSPTPR